MAVITCVAYWFIFLAYQYVFDMPLFVGESHDLANIVRSILLIPQPEGEYALNNPTWYLATLIQCFIVFELYRYLLKRYTKLKRYLAGGLLGVFSLCLVLHLPTMHWSIVYGRGLVPFLQEL